MQSAHNPASETWHIATQALDRQRREVVIEWAAGPCPDEEAIRAAVEGGGALHGCGCAVRRTVRAAVPAAARAILVDRAGEPPIWLNFPAAMSVELEVDEGYRTTPVQVTVELERDDDSGPEPRAVVALVTVRRRGAATVTGEILRRVGLQDLTDWMLQNPPVAQWIGKRPSGMDEVARIARSSARTGKRGTYSVDPDAVAAVLREAGTRSHRSALETAFPNVPIRTLYRAWDEALEAGLDVPAKRAYRRHN